MLDNTDTDMILLRDVEVTLTSAAGAVNVLRGISLSIEPGATVSLVGPSGSGKTTLLMTIAGLVRPNAGYVRVAGTDLAALDEDGLARFRREAIGIVFQAFHLVPTMTALENVALPLEFAARGDAFAVAADALDAVGLSARRDHYPSELSGGEQQRVALARAFAATPRLILADEPTGNLDGATGAHVMDLLFRLAADRGTTLLLITHESELARRANRIIELADGKVLRDSARPLAAVAG
ncbi:MAG TPA: ABC transporter ATP-binding protein [Stellaceae bacterium]|nr:ABC transporter ATP-binding protein [Stellaceae bacterium]